jgi:anti-sigma regulatory factor (Ser/Thr protein kinase)/CheY-like chemotaxis protein
MGDLLEALLDISRLDMAGFTVRRLHFALDPLLRRVVNAHAAEAADKDLQLRCGRTDAWVDSDPHLLERILNNLVANAIRYTPRGSVSIAEREFGDSLSIEIIDTGIGIAEEDLPNIFQEFYQVGNAERDVGKGLGLGLAIVDRLAKSLQHEVSVVSRLGNGTTFTVTAVPRVAADTVTEHSAETEWSEEFAAHILLVQEGDAVSDNLFALLQNWGCRVSEAQNAAAIATVLNGGDRPAAVICDDCCYAAASQVLASMKNPPPLLLLGEQSAVGDIAMAEIAGRLSKPVRPARLRALLRHLLDERKPGAEELCEPAQALTP